MAPFEVHWDPFDPADPGPCLKVIVMNAFDYIKAGRDIGLEYPEPHAITALIDTGSPFTIISKTFAKNWKLVQTGARSPIRTMGGDCLCDEYSGSMSFPDSNLPPIGTLRLRGTDFNREPFYSCIIGRDVLKNWDIRFDGHRKRITISA
jgi:hypothetical protein